MAGFSIDVTSLIGYQKHAYIFVNTSRIIVFYIYIYIYRDVIYIYIKQIYSAYIRIQIELINSQCSTKLRTFSPAMERYFLMGNDRPFPGTTMPYFGGADIYAREKIYR